VGNDDLHIFDAQGKLKKTVKGGFQSTSNSLAPSISKQGDVIFGTNIYHALSKKVTSFNKENQTYFTSEPIIDRNGNLIYHYKNYAKNINVLVSMKLATSKINWKININHNLGDQWLISRDGTIYVTGTKLLAIR
jgi:predicted restriction endonuclease